VHVRPLHLWPSRDPLVVRTARRNRNQHWGPGTHRPALASPPGRRVRLRRAIVFFAIGRSQRLVSPPGICHVWHRTVMLSQLTASASDPVR
jgi:hypothetical protein